MDIYVNMLLEVTDELNRHKHVLNLLTTIGDVANIEDVQVVVYMLNDRLQELNKNIAEALQ